MFGAAIGASEFAPLWQRQNLPEAAPAKGKRQRHEARIEIRADGREILKVRVHNVDLGISSPPNVPEAAISALARRHST